MNMVIANDYDEFSLGIADRVANYINLHPKTLLCLAAGDTPQGALKQLVRLQEDGKVDLSSVYYAGLDEWVGLGPDDIGSCKQVMFDIFYSPAKIPVERIHMFDGLDIDTDHQRHSMEAWIKQHGGIGLALLGIGMNGHIGFNEPGAPDTSGCFTLPLDDITKKVSAKYFQRSIQVEYGITIGWRMLKQAESVIMIANGGHKSDIVHRSFCEPMTLDVPASLMQDHRDLTLVLDTAAAAKI